MQTSCMHFAEIITDIIARVIIPNRLPKDHMNTLLDSSIVWFTVFPAFEGGSGTILPVPICKHKGDESVNMMLFFLLC